MPGQKELEQLGKEPLNPEATAMRGEQGNRLREAIRGLPPHYRIVLVLRDMEGFTDEEVSEITGLRPVTIRVRLHRARLFVRRELTRRTAEAESKRRRKASSPQRPGRCKKMFAGLSDYLDGELDHFSCEEIEAHLDGCEPCKKFLRSLESAIENCRRSPADCPDREKAATVRKKLLAAYSRALAGAGN